MRLRILAAASAAATFSIAFAPVAHASTSSPLDCPGVKAVHGGFQATKDFACWLDWRGSHQFFDLKGHTFTGVVVTADGDHLTLRNGSLVTSGSWLAGDHITLQHMRVSSGGDNVSDFLLEAGNGFVADHSTFTNITSAVALDFYFGGNAKVTNSTFTHDHIGVSVQAGGNVTIEHDRFIGDRLGVNMWDEDGGGVTNVTVAENIFEHNTYAGVSVSGFAENGALDGIRIERNAMLADSGPGLLVSLSCMTGDVCTPPHQHVTHNLLVGNGSDPNAVSRSGMYADSLDENGAPAAGNLAHVVVSFNGAYGNADLGFDVEGVVDGGHNKAAFNGNPAQCVGLTCHVNVFAPHLAAPLRATDQLAQVRHKR